MSRLIERNRTRNVEERYEMLRKTLAHYLLLQVGTFVAAAGFDAIGPAMNTLTNKKGRGIVSTSDKLRRLSWYERIRTDPSPEDEALLQATRKVSIQLGMPDWHK